MLNWVNQSGATTIVFIFICFWCFDLLFDFDFDFVRVVLIVLRSSSI